MEKNDEKLNIKSIKQFLEQLEKYQKEVKTEFLVYRGQAESDWTLTPKIARKMPALNEDQITNFSDLEIKIQEDFRRWIPTFYPHYPDEDVTILCLGQHYGLYTRLLDWTQNPLIALWFAIDCDQVKKRTKDSAVWILGYEKKDILNPGVDFKLSKLKRTKVLYPKLNDKRISSQASIFTIHQITKDGKFVPLEGNRFYKKNIRKIIIDKDHMYSIRKELAQFITKHMIFQDMSALCDDINDKHSLALASMSL